MQFLKVLTILIVGICTLAAVDSGSITVHLVDLWKSKFDVAYEYNGENLTKTSEFLSYGENETITFPDQAVNIYLEVKEANRSLVNSNIIFTKFYPSSVSKCFKLSRPGWFEESCVKLPATKGYSITARNYGELQSTYERAEFWLSYTYNGSRLTESSGYFIFKGNKAVQIPDDVTNIQLTLYGINSFKTSSVLKYKHFIWTIFYPTPVKKCIRIYSRFEEYLWVEEPCQKLPSWDGHIISIKHMGVFDVTAEIMYEYDGSNWTEISDTFSAQHKIVRIPDKAVNINLRIYDSNYIALATKFLPVPDKVCFMIFGCREVAPQLLEKPCEKLPATNGNSISVRNEAKTSIVLQIIYEYDGRNLTESSEAFLPGEKWKIQIPDKATNILATL